MATKRESQAESEPESDIDERTNGASTAETNVNSVSASLSEPAADATAEEPAERTPPEPDLDVVFDVLRNQRRRHVLERIEECDGETTLGALAEHIGGIENNKPPEALNAQERKRVYVGLYQCHLPKMDDAGAVEFDQHRGTVDRGPAADRYHEFLERDVESDRPWFRYYGGVAAVALAAFLLAELVVGGGAVVLAASLVVVLGIATLHAKSVEDDETDEDDEDEATTA